MPKQRLGFAALNIVASPHPEGVYARLLRAAADQEVPVWGSDWATITTPARLKSLRDGWLQGRVLVWSAIDRDGKWINKTKKDEATKEERDKLTNAIPEGFEPNYRSFNYLFVEEKHRLILEIDNELGQRFGPTRAERFFSRLFSPDFLPKDFPVIDVTVIPEEESVDKVLGMQGLRRLEIFIKRPNPDDSSDSYNEIMGELSEQGARSQKIELVKAPKVKAIIPNERTKELAQIGATDGYVRGEGRDGSGRPIFESTQDHPKIRYRQQDESSFEILYTAARLFL